ncbi:MAG: RDD family protein, partial [Deltaproteobacteria bacterium]|nr:RDD family protein [Deltaproteobacteria bacterium]
KMMVKLTVVNEKGDVPSFAEGFFRTVGGLLSLLCGGWGYFRVLFDDEQRGWNDRISGTRVVANVDALADKADPMACESKCDEVNG